MAEEWHGPWKVVGDPHRNDRSMTSFNSQISCIFKHPEKEDLYIAMADRWLPNLPETEGDGFYTGEAYRKVEQSFKEEFSGIADKKEKDEETDYGKDDTSIARYVWLPIRFEGDVPYIDLPYGRSPFIMEEMERTWQFRKLLSLPERKEKCLNVLPSGHFAIQLHIREGLIFTEPEREFSPWILRQKEL